MTEVFMIKPKFHYVAGVASFLATLIWFFFLFLGPKLGWDTTEAFLILHKNPLMPWKYIISYACFLFSMVAFTGLYFRIKNKFPGLGLIALWFFILGTTVDFVFRAVEGATVHFTWAKNYLAAADVTVKSEYLFKINHFNEVGAGLIIVFGFFFTISNLLLSVCTWGVHKVLSILFLLAGLFIMVAYSAEYLPNSIPAVSWIFYEILEISLYILLGIWLFKGDTLSLDHSPELMSR